MAKVLCGSCKSPFRLPSEAPKLGTLCLQRVVQREEGGGGGAKEAGTQRGDSKRESMTQMDPKVRHAPLLPSWASSWGN